MRRFIVIVFISFISVLANAQPVAKISFTGKTCDLGIIKSKSHKYKAIFYFTNTGTAPLIIEKIDVSCGCITPSFSKAPIKESQKGVVEVIFDPKTISGTFLKYLYVKTNAEGDITLLKIKGVIKD